MATENEKKHICSYEDCNKCFAKESRLILHIRTHTGEIATPEDDVCATCVMLRKRITDEETDNDKLEASIELHQHIVIEKFNDQRPFTCAVSDCCKSYTRAAHLKRHEEMAHSTGGDVAVETPTKYRCDIDGCESLFSSQHNLKKHIKRTHQKDTYTCHKCHAEFRKHHQLTTHWQTEHAQSMAYVCSVEGCGKGFSFPNKLKRHEKQHEGYKCDEPACEASFDKWTMLRKHKMLQHSTGQHECRTCGKTFSQKQWLKKHLLVHRDTRETMECPYENCQREYFDLRNLNSHIHSYHEGKKFECGEEGCGRLFASKQKLQEHSRLHDPTKPLPKKKRPKKKTPAESLTGVSQEGDDRVNDLDDMLCSPSHLTSDDLEFAKRKYESSDESRDISDSDSHTKTVDMIIKNVFSHKLESEADIEPLKVLETATGNLVAMETNSDTLPQKSDVVLGSMKETTSDPGPSN